jgi:hypothetical protein
MFESAGIGLTDQDFELIFNVGAKRVVYSVRCVVLNSVHCDGR